MCALRVAGGYAGLAGEREVVDLCSSILAPLRLGVERSSLSSLRAPRALAVQTRRLASRRRLVQGTAPQPPDRGSLTARACWGKVTRPVWRVMNDEKDLSTEQPSPEEEARLPGTHEDEKRAQGVERTPPERAAASRGLSGGPRSKDARLRRRREFQRVYGQGRRAAGRWLVLFAVSRGEGVPSRMGITASRRVGGAVVRSRCKRRVRELFRQYFVEAAEPVDLVINVRRGCSTAPWGELVEDFLTCMSRLRSQLAWRSGSSGRTSVGSRRSCRRRAGTTRPARSTRRRRSGDTVC